jgi:hypothetical protein
VAAEDGATRRRHLPWLAPPSSRPPLLELPPPPRSPLGFARRRRARCGGGGGGEHQRHAQDAETEQLTAQHTIVGGHEAQEVIEELVRDEDASLAGSPRAAWLASRPGATRARRAPGGNCRAHRRGGASCQAAGPTRHTVTRGHRRSRARRRPSSRRQPSSWPM